MQPKEDPKDAKCGTHFARPAQPRQCPSAPPTTTTPHQSPAQPQSPLSGCLVHPSKTERQEGPPEPRPASSGPGKGHGGPAEESHPRDPWDETAKPEAEASRSTRTECKKTQYRWWFPPSWRPLMLMGGQSLACRGCRHPHAPATRSQRSTTEHSTAAVHDTHIRPRVQSLSGVGPTRW